MLCLKKLSFIALKLEKTERLRGNVERRGARGDRKGESRGGTPGRPEVIICLFVGEVYRQVVCKKNEVTMSKMKRSFLYQAAKEIVHDALKQHSNAIPWFIGIYDDWTIGHLKKVTGTNHINFHSENFSKQDFYKVCDFISEKIEKEVNLEFIIHYAQFKNEKGRLVVQQLIEAVTDLIMDKPARCDTYQDSHSSKKSSGYINGIPEYLWHMKNGTSALDSLLDEDDEDEDEIGE